MNKSLDARGKQIITDQGARYEQPDYGLFCLHKFFLSLDNLMVALKE